MRVTVRAKLLLIVGTATAVILGVLVGSTWIGIGQNVDLENVEGRLVPKLALGPKLTNGFDQLRQTFQDAVAAQDTAALDEARVRAEALVVLVDEADAVIDPTRELELRLAIQEYHEVAQAISRRMIAGETGEKIVDDIAVMQTKFSRTGSAIERAVTLSESELAQGFALVRDANLRADRFRLVIGSTGLIALICLSLWLGRGVFESLSNLSSGLAQFATGYLSQSISVSTDDELADLAREANQMAASLQRISEQKEATEWLKDGQAKLAEALRGTTTPRETAERAVECLVKRVGACAGCLYVVEREALKPLGGYGVPWRVSADEEAPNGARVDGPGDAPEFALGQGLLGQAAVAQGVHVVDEVPAGYLRLASGLGAAEPQALVFVPLVRDDVRVGVIELAFFGTVHARAREFLSLVHEAVVVSIVAAQSRATLEQLLAQAREFTRRLTAQEEELRASNEELHSQQQELRVTNEELAAQREALGIQNTNLQAVQARLQEKARELEQVSAYKSQFLARMSHELRTPLNSMLLLSQLMTETTLPPEEIVDHAATINAAGNDLLALINQILDLAKIESGKEELSLSTVRLDQFAQHAERVFRPLANKRGLELVVELAAGLPVSVVTDGRRVERIITNLLGNAIKFTRQGQVKLRIERPRYGEKWQAEHVNSTRHVAFTVADTGSGIEPESLERIFSPFEQASDHREKAVEGTGLGLAIARESARLLGGDLYVESTLGVGSTFTCVLPEATSDGVEKAAPRLRSEGHPAKDDAVDLGQGEPYLLIVEDDAVFAEQLVSLTHGRGMKAVVATTGHQAIEYARRRLPLGIILDVNLPDVDGFAVVNDLRSDPTTADVPVHFISGVDAKQRGLHVGAIGYLTKPATRAELIGALRSLIAAGSSESARVLVVEDDPRDGRSILEILRHEGIDAEHVTSAGSARRALKTEAFGCIILDLGLPDMDGLELLETLAREATVGLPRVIVYTGRALTKQETRRLEAYAEAIILKHASSSSERLAEELRLFVHHLEDAASRKGQGLVLEPQVEISLAGCTLLLVDDDMRTAFALSALLRSKGATVLLGDTGKEALAMLAANPQVDALLIDIMMPEMDGYEAMREIRKQPQYSRLPIIALTAKAMKGEKERCLEAGASDYLPKPVNSRQLMLTLKSWLSHGRSDR